jgi:hypothetical protein
MATAAVGAIDEDAANAGLAHVAEGDFLGPMARHQSAARSGSQIINILGIETATGGRGYLRASEQI